MNNKNRGKFLTIMLLVSAIPLGLVLISTLLVLSRVGTETLPTNLARAGMYGMALGVLNLVSLFAIWSLKKWGIYLFIVIAVLQQVVNLYFPVSSKSMTNPLTDNALMIVVYALLAWAIVQKWKYFK